MITLKKVPSATASATAQTFLVECDERVCRPYCTNGAKQPVGTMTYQTGAVTVINGVAMVPLVVTVVVTIPSDEGCCKSQIYVEQTLVPFLATASNTVTVTSGAASVITPTNVKCCRAYGIHAVGTVALGIA